ncbi:MAG: glycosyltransferase [Betaproteobacteria bacterium]
MAASTKPAIVFVSHAWGGGIRRYMNDVAQLVRDDADVLYLEPADADTVRLYSPAAADDFSAWFRLPDDLSLLARTLKAIGVARLHVHHVHGLPRSILQLPVTASLPYDCTLHDYYAICPQYHLADATGRFCTQHESGACAACGVQRSAQWDLDVRAWRTLLGDFLRGAARVIAPSRDVADRVARDLPGLSIDVWPHPESAMAAPARILRVVTLGLLSREKGLDVVAGCAEDVRRRGLPMVFRVLGATAAPIAQWPDAPLTIHGSYEESSLPLLLAGERADVLFFPAQIPETYAYTLTTAMASGLPIVASSLGAFTERLAGQPRVRLLPWDATAAQWNAALMEVGRAHASDAGRDDGVDATVTAAS